MNSRTYARTKVTETLTREWAADVKAMREDFVQELADEGAVTDEQVIRACWADDVREPYFELQREEDAEIELP